MTFIVAPLLVRGERDQRQVTRPLDRLLQEALVPGAGTRDPPRQDLGAFGDELLQELDVLEVHVVDLVRAELADLAAAVENLPWAGHGLDLPRRRRTGGSVTADAARA